MTNADLNFFDQDALLIRLFEGLNSTEKEVVFVVGAPLTAFPNDKSGVADVDAVIQIVRNEFVNIPRQLEKFDALTRSSTNAYQDAFDFLHGRIGQDAANRVIKQAVAQALKNVGGTDWTTSIQSLPSDALTNLEENNEVWRLSPAVSALGTLIAKFPNRFGKILLTSNFDPLIEVSIRGNGAAVWRTSLPNDGSFSTSNAPGCQVIHMHGYWNGSDTLHTNKQLVRDRPTLKNDLLNMLKDKLVVVLAYGGWPDIFTGALAGIVSNNTLFPEILWAFYGETPIVSDYLYTTLQPGIDRNRVTLYKGVDCHKFLPELLDRWEGHAEVAHSIKHAVANPIVGTAIHKPDRGKLFRLAPLDCDRPPSVEVWVGREEELRALETSRAKVVIICGMGGEGKSALAAHYIANLGDRDGRYKFWDWRDCKEQSDRIRTQVIEIIVRLSNNVISSDQLRDADEQELAEIFIDQAKYAEAVIVFDNVDSYVDLINKTFISLIDRIIQIVASIEFKSRLIFTCRPDVHYTSSSVVTFSMNGLTLEEAVELFSKRAPNSCIPEVDIAEAHASTKGHAFWLDLLAIQVNKVPGTTLRKLMDDMRRGREDVPDVLSSIWDILPSREQTVLRFMAEAVRPETEKTIENFVSSELNYKNFSRALKSLKSLNLIVVKPESQALDLYDLHPLVRQFVRTKFEKAERTSYIRVVINQYETIIGAIGAMLGIHLPFSMLERWSQKAELEISAGMSEEAFETLGKVEGSLIGGGHAQEYVRVGRLLLESLDWETASSQYKKFDQVIGVMVDAYDSLGEFEYADAILERYESTIPQKTARYIKFCDIKAFSFWQRGNFELAIDWANSGVNLKNETHVDTAFDCAHTLALAQRDAGNPEIALEFFRKGIPLNDLISAENKYPSDGAMFGNIGRCLQFMGELDRALIFYRRSLHILEHETSSMSKSNRAYARRWIGQILAEQGQNEKAVAFFVDAIRLLGAAAPVRVRELCVDIENARKGDFSVVSEPLATRTVAHWMRATNV